MAAMAFAVIGEQACAALGFALPAAVAQQLQEKRFAILMGAWFVGNTLTNSLTNTGAFEVLYGTDVIFSKLATGSMPTIEQIVIGVQEAMAAAQ